MATRLPPAPYARFAELNTGGALGKALDAGRSAKLLAKFTFLTRTRVIY